MKTKIGLVLLNYYGLVDTLECLESLKTVRTTNIDLQTYVINATDKGSEKDSTHGEQIKKKYPHVHLLESDNLGFSGAHNVATKAALKDGADEIIWLNNDTTVHKDFITHLHEAISKEGVGAAAPKIYFYKGNEFHKDQYKKSDLGKVIWYAGGIIDWDNVYAFHKGVDEVDRGQFDKKEDTDFVTGCCIITKREVLEKVGFLWDPLFLYLEDTDWSVRIQNSRLKTIYAPKSIIWHKNAGSTKGSGSSLHVYYQTRNRIYFGLKYAPLRTKLALIKESLIKLSSGSNTEKKAIKHAFTFRFGNRHAK
ncbi:glycosyltransferase [Patescibacteria group bacterium]